MFWRTCWVIWFKALTNLSWFHSSFSTLCDSSFTIHILTYIHDVHVTCVVPGFPGFPSLSSACLKHSMRFVLLSRRFFLQQGWLVGFIFPRWKPGALDLTLTHTPSCVPMLHTCKIPLFATQPE